MLFLLKGHICFFLCRNYSFPFLPFSWKISVCFSLCRQGEGLHCWSLKDKLAIASPSSACFAEVESEVAIPMFCCHRTDLGLGQLAALPCALLPWLPAECSSAALRLTWSTSLGLDFQGSLLCSPSGYFSSHFFWPEKSNTGSSLCYSEINIYLKSPQLPVLLSSLNGRTFDSFMP